MGCFTPDTLFIVRLFSTRPATSLTSSGFCVKEHMYLLYSIFCMHHDISPDITEFYMCTCISLYIRIKEALVKYDHKLSPDRKISDAIDDMLEYTQLTGQRKHGYT